MYRTPKFRQNNTKTCLVPVLLEEGKERLENGHGRIRVEGPALEARGRRPRRARPAHEATEVPENEVERGRGLDAQAGNRGKRDT